MAENKGFWNKTEATAKGAWYGLKNSAESLKEKLSEHRRRAEEEIDYAEMDFYEDNLYDEPEYWRSSHYHSTGSKKH